MDIPGAAGMARAPEGICCPQCSARLPVGSFFAHVHADDKEFVVPDRLEMQATFVVAAQQPVRANCIERPFIRVCVLCCIRWHKQPSYMGKDGKISSTFKRNAQKSKNWRPN
eukprot:3817365-Lingulodinium_polyedra.AAC.1